jgi:hypothetical protein
LTLPLHIHLDVRIDRATTPEGCVMATTRMKFRSLVSVGALVLITACGPATADEQGPAGEETEETEETPGSEDQPDCRNRGSELLPC